MEMWRNPLADRVLQPDGEIEVLEPIGGDSLDYLQSVYRYPAAPQAVRLRAAGLALPFERPKLVAVANVSHEDLAARLVAMKRRCAALPKVIEASAESAGKAITPAGAPFARLRRKP